MIEVDDLKGMTEHWLSTQSCSYLGSDYGHNIRDTLQRPVRSVDGDGFIRKLSKDVPLIAALPSDTVGVYLSETGIDSSVITLELAGLRFGVGTSDN
ncbi:MAG: hypothetical protein ACRCWB_11490 [Enterovibrio sp.]